MSSANQEPPRRPTPPAGSAGAAPAPAGQLTILGLPPPPQGVGAVKGTPTELSAAPPHTILGYTAPVEPGPNRQPASEDLLAPGTKVGDYEIIELIGAGGMGSVYAARYPMIDRRVAIKVIASHLCRDPGVVRQFVIEARAANQIANRHVVDIHTLGTLPDGRPYLVMQLLRGETLSQRMSYGPLDVDEAVAILEQIAEAIEAAHAVPIIHRDLKPENVFLEDGSDGPEVKILDFGIAKLAGDGDETRRTRPGEVLVGTPHYMAPEQARAQLVGTPADLYSLGLIAFEMLAGRPPFEAESAAEILVAHLHSVPPSLKSVRPDIPDRLDRLVERLLAKDPGERPNATEVRSTLRRLDDPKTYPRALPPIVLPLQDRVRLWLRRPRNRLMLAAQVVIGLLMLAAYLFLGGDDEVPAATGPAPAAQAAPAGPGAAPAAADKPAADKPAPSAPGPAASGASAPAPASAGGSAPASGASAPAPARAGGSASPAKPAAPDSAAGGRPRADRDAAIRDPF